MLTCLQIRFSSFRDFPCLLCISLSCLNLLRFRVNSSCSAGYGTVLYNLWWYLSFFFAIIFAFLPHFYDNVPSVMQFSITCWKSMEKNGNFSVGSNVRLFRMRMKIWLASSCWQKKGKFLCEESCTKSIQYGLWLQVVCLCLVLSFTPAWSKCRVTTTEGNQSPFCSTCILLGSCLYFCHCTASWVSPKKQSTQSSCSHSTVTTGHLIMRLCFSSHFNEKNPALPNHSLLAL